MTSPRAARTVLIGLALVALVLLGVVVYPFAKALFIAAVLAGALYPWCDRLSARLGGRRQLATGIFTLAVVLLLVVPLAILALMLGREIVDGVSYLRSTLQSEGVAGVINDLPGPARSLARKVIDQIPGGEQQLQEMSGIETGRAVAAVRGVLAATSSAVVQTVMMLIAFFFLLLDGKELVEWLSEAAPLPKGQTLELLSDFRKVSVTVLVSSAATAGIQAAVALVGYLLARVPHPFFFTFVTFLVAFVPAVGAGSVVVAMALLLFATGHSGAALFLGLWGIIAVGLSDNVVKPLLMKGRMEIHGAVIFFALLGGLAVFGAVGLLAGPLIVAFFMAVVRLHRRGTTV